MARVKSPPILDQKMVEVWAKAGLAPVVLTDLDHNTVHTLRHRLYRTRLKMREAMHPDTEVANQAVISIQHDPKTTDKYRLVIYPANLLIQSALERAGITDNDPPPLE